MRTTYDLSNDFQSVYTYVPGIIIGYDIGANRVGLMFLSGFVTSSNPQKKTHHLASNMKRLYELIDEF